ncbi:MAG: hypothetical protein K0R12_985 [Gammaproteobacteria bacterium]|nr:hypothetical protein [Gammaproteobacteria bacterium]
MKNILRKNTRSIQHPLIERGIKFSVIEFSANTRTAEAAARAVGCAVGQIIKSLIFRIKTTGEPLLILVSGANRVNEYELKKRLGTAIEKADDDFAHRVTGFAIDGIPPIGHQHEIHTLIDKDLLQYPICWAAAGTSHSVFSVPFSALLLLTRGKIIQVT